MDNKGDRFSRKYVFRAISNKKGYWVVKVNPEAESQRRARKDKSKCKSINMLLLNICDAILAILWVVLVVCADLRQYAAKVELRKAI